MASLPFRRYTPRPGDPDWAQLAHQARELAHELASHLDPPRRGPAEWRRRLRSYRTAARNYRINRRLSRARREDLRPLYFIWTVTRPCNFRCDYCDDHRGRRYPELPHHGELDLDGGRELLRVMRSGAPSVYFAGGEPTLRDDLPELTRAARDLDYYPIVVNTNGSLLHRVLRRERWRSWLADTDILVVSLDGLALEHLARLWSHPRPEEVVRNLLALRELARPLGFKLMVNTVIRPGECEEARAVLDWCADLGIWFCPVPVNVGAHVDHALRDDPDYPALVERILSAQRAGQLVSGSARMNERLLNARPLVCRNTLKPHVDHDGRLFWPCKASIGVEPVMIDVLRYRDLDALYEDARRDLDPAGFHGNGPGQCGGNCNWAQNYTTDAYAFGLDHPASVLGDVRSFLRR